MSQRVQSTVNGFKWLYVHWRLWTGIVLWLVAMFRLATAAEGVNKNEWIGIGSIPITLLTVGFVLPRRVNHRAQLSA